MAGDQQFCLRWNNHQSTLVSVFDSLLENSVLVDCTLAADGQQLKAHKVVLSACSPYLENLLSQHYDKHPIIILKDVKYPELKAMLDYMYRGEVNISQDLLGSFLKAAESLQIKGLTDSGGGGEPPNKLSDSNRKQPPPNQPTTLTHINNQSRLNACNLSNASHADEKKQAASLVLPSHVLDSRSQSPLMIREGSVSPTLRKRKKLNQLNKSDNPKLVKLLSEVGRTTNCQSDEPASQIAPTSPCTTMAVIKSEPDFLPLSEKTEFKQNIDDSNGIEDSELVNDENNENIYQDATTNSTTSPGPSHHFISQGINEKSTLGSSSDIILQSSDDLQSSQELKRRIRYFQFGVQNKTTYFDPLQPHNSELWTFQCPGCEKVYKSKSSLGLHIRLECGKEPKFNCPFCQKKCHQKGNLKNHIITKHNDKMEVKLNDSNILKK